MTEKPQDQFAALIERHFWAIAALILTIGLAFRLPGIATRSLWIDELFTEWFASRSFSELWFDVPSYETHPPFYYTLLKIWTLAFGNSELGLRSLSLLSSLATILTVAVSGHMAKLGGKTTSTGLLAALFLAVNYASIREAQNARPYALQALLCTVAVLAAVLLVTRLLNSASARSARDWLLPAMVLGTFAGAGLWIHNTGLFIAAGLWAGLALTLLVTPACQRLRNFGIFFAAGLLALLVWAPYVPIFIAQSQAFSGLAFWLVPKSRDLYSAWLLVLGENWIALLLALLLLAIGLYRLARVAPAIALVVGAVLLLPLYSVLAVSFALKPIYIQRLFVWMMPLCFLVIAFGIVNLTRSIWPRLILALIVLAFAGQRTIVDYDRPIDDWKSIVAEIARNAQPDDVVIAVPAEGSIAVGYYARRQPNFPEVVCVPGCYPQRHLPRTYMSNFGAPAIIQADSAIIDQALKKHRRVWLVQVSVQLYDPKNIVRSRVAAVRKFVRFYGNSLARVDLFE